MNAKDKIKAYFALKKKDIDTLFSLLKEDSTIFTPNDGLIKGRETIKKFVLNEKKWLNDQEAKIELMNFIDTEKRLIIELIFCYPDQDSKIEVPTAVVMDIESDYIKHIRFYHSNWPRLKTHKIIKPVLKSKNDLNEPDILKQYLDGLRKANKDLILSLFEKNAYVQEPSGSRFRHNGPKEINEFYNHALAKGGIPLKLCTVTFDGKQVGIEYVFDEWGNKKFDTQAGIAVYKIGNSGKIAEVRIYDDATPPE